MPFATLSLHENKNLSWAYFLPYGNWMELEVEQAALKIKE